MINIQDKPFVIVTIPNFNKNEAIFKPYLKVKIDVNKDININDVYNLVKNKYPYFVSFYWKNLVIQKAQ